jgi:uncharacterized protein YbjT (DUF2867 family)
VTTIEPRPTVPSPASLAPTATVRASPDGSELAVPRGSLVLVTGASGYIGGRLVGELLEAGYRVRCLARTPAKLDAAPWRDEVEVVEGDVTADLTTAVAGIDAVYYLVHSIGSSDEWEERDRRAAANLRDAAAKAGVRRIVYLGGLGREATDGGPGLSAHLASRHEVGRVLAEGPVPVTELRAAVIIGSGSASFEMLRYLVEVLPVMVTPVWVDTRCQPTAVRDILRYLVEVLAEPRAAGRIFEVGGPEVLTYRQMMDRYAELAGLPKRKVIRVPFLTPGLSSHWVSVVTPLPQSLARPLVQSLVNEVIVEPDDPAAGPDDLSIRQLLPGALLTYREAVELALARQRSGEVPTSWAGAELEGRSPADPMPTDPDWAGGTVLADVRERDVEAPAAVVHAALCELGGATGWYSSDLLWSVRGLLDKLVGGVGMRRGRRDPHRLRVGDAVDFWRVEAIQAPTLLRLRAEMKLPGEAWLEWRVEERGSGSHVRQFARYHPKGLWGRAYWLGVAPFHRFVFPGLLNGVCAEAERRVAADASVVTAEGPAPRGRAG